MCGWKRRKRRRILFSSVQLEERECSNLKVQMEIGINSCFMHREGEQRVDLGTIRHEERRRLVVEGDNYRVINRSEILNLARRSEWEGGKWYSASQFEIGDSRIQGDSVN